MATLDSAMTTEKMRAGGTISIVTVKSGGQFRVGSETPGAPSVDGLVAGGSSVSDWMEKGGGDVVNAMCPASSSSDLGRPLTAYRTPVPIQMATVATATCRNEDHRGYG